MFIEQALFGLAARQDCRLSQIARALEEPIKLKKTPGTVVASVGRLAQFCRPLQPPRKACARAIMP